MSPKRAPEPSSANDFHDRGICHTHQGSIEVAIAGSSKAIAPNPNNARCYRQPSLVYLFADRRELAQADEEMCEDLRNQGATEVMS